MSEHTAEIERLEHEELSPWFIGLLRQIGELRHEDCAICEPPIYESGLLGHMWTKALDCPLCGEQIKRGAAVLVRIDYERHLDERHLPSAQTSDAKETR